MKTFLPPFFKTAFAFSILLSLLPAAEVPFPKLKGALLFEENFTTAKKGPLTEHVFGMVDKMAVTEGKSSFGIPEAYEIIEKGLGTNAGGETHVVWYVKERETLKQYAGLVAHFWVNIRGLRENSGGVSLGFIGKVGTEDFGKFGAAITGFPDHPILSLAGGPTHAGGLFISKRIPELLYSAAPKLKAVDLPFPVMVTLILGSDGKAAVWLNLKKEWEGITNYGNVEYSKLPKKEVATEAHGLLMTFLDTNTRTDDDEPSVLKAFRFEGLPQKEYESYLKKETLDDNL